MTNLTQRNEQLSASIADINDKITMLQEQLSNLTQEVRVQTQRHKAQEQLSKEWKKLLNTVTSKAKDACSVYGDVDVVEDMLTDVANCFKEITDNFEEYQSSHRYLDQVEREENDRQHEENQNNKELNATDIIPVQEVLPETSTVEDLGADTTMMTQAGIINQWKNLPDLIKVLLRQPHYFNIPANINSARGIGRHIHSLQISTTAFNKAINKAEEELSQGVVLTS